MVLYHKILRVCGLHQNNVYKYKKDTYMKIKAVVMLLFIPSLIVCMEQSNSFHHKGDFLCMKIDLIDEKSEDSISEEEIFDRYFCDPIITESYDDVLQYTLVRSWLLIQLCVQAAQTNSIKKIAIDEFLEKLKKNEVKISGKGNVAITKKDLSYRLLTGIPTGHTHSLINGKKVYLALGRYETDFDKIKNEKIKERNALLPQPEWEWGKGLEPVVYQYSGTTLLVDHYFENDMEHHTKVVQEFKQLLEK